MNVILEAECSFISFVAATPTPIGVKVTAKGNSGMVSTTARPPNISPPRPTKGQEFVKKKMAKLKKKGKKPALEFSVLGGPDKMKETLLRLLQGMCNIINNESLYGFQNSNGKIPYIFQNNWEKSRFFSCTKITKLTIFPKPHAKKLQIVGIF